MQLTRVYIAITGLLFCIALERPQTSLALSKSLLATLGAVMASRLVRRMVRPLVYTTIVGAGTGLAIYVTYRPRDIPGLEAAAVPPPTYGEGGVFRPPSFPLIKNREQQIEDLKKSSGFAVESVAQKAKSGFAGLLSSSRV